MGDRGDLDGSSDDLTRRIIKAIIKVHQILGPGFIESIYRRALLIELRQRGIRTETEVVVDIDYEGQIIGQHRIDLLAEGRVVIELKSVEALIKAHYSQVRSYLRATRLSVALLVNFGREKADFRRIEVSSPSSPSSPRFPT